MTRRFGNGQTPTIRRMSQLCDLHRSPFTELLGDIGVIRHNSATIRKAGLPASKKMLRTIAITFTDNPISLRTRHITTNLNTVICMYIYTTAAAVQRISKQTA